MISATRYHDFSAGHRVAGHENKCGYLHGHNYRVHFTCSANRLDHLGRVLDFSVINIRLCQWLEVHWDHKMLLWEDDPIAGIITSFDPDAFTASEECGQLKASLVQVPFNPTAELMANHLLRVIGPQQLAGTGVLLRRVVVEETRKCSASAELDATLVWGAPHET